MSKADEYRERSALCRQYAEAAESEESRQGWLSIAEDWLCMVPDEAGQPPADVTGPHMAPGEALDSAPAVIDPVQLAGLEEDIARWRQAR